MTRSNTVPPPHSVPEMRCVSCQDSFIAFSGPYCHPCLHGHLTILPQYPSDQLRPFVLLHSPPGPQGPSKQPQVALCGSVPIVCMPPLLCSQRPYWFVCSCLSLQIESAGTPLLSLANILQSHISSLIKSSRSSPSPAHVAFLLCSGPMLVKTFQHCFSGVIIFPL